MIAAVFGSQCVCTKTLGRTDFYEQPCGPRGLETGIEEITGDVIERDFSPGITSS